MTSGPFNSSVVLYRKALASAQRARRIATGELPVTVNKKGREADDTIIAVFLAHAAVESAWHWEQSLTGVGRLRWPGQRDEAPPR